MKVISFFNVKGGVGKTTSALNVAYILSAKHKKNVLLIDMDPQANSTYFYDCERKEFSMADVLAGRINIKDAIYRTGFYKLDIIPANRGLWAFEKELLMAGSQQQYKLKEAIQEIDKKYDVIILDCTNMVGSLLIINAFVASDYVFVPMRDEAWATKGLILTLQVLEEMQEYNPALQLGGCFYSAWEKRRVNVESFNALKKTYGNKIMDIKIRKNKDVPETSYSRTPLLLYDKKSTVTSDYLDLTKSILKIIGG